ncbi:hypothetical protein SASPL_104224 [Salvia splendens]|uniref:C2 domain-containing protein n=1 Tax=Salvia splendens TaxID=180675 RepID=A0A8X9A8V9_SALSN|nr:protein SRC2 homolog [Salvia splendens]KAG6432643.1 hypothetical protein SASPL_104224 [Salvia splendens]
MECRKLEITLVSAQNLPNVRNTGRMKVYAKLSLKGDSKTTRKSHVDYESETNPRWNFVSDYTVSEETVRQPGVSLVVRLMCKRTLGDRLVGKVKIPVKSLFDMGRMSRKILSYEVAGTPEGRLNLLYSFSETMIVRQPSPGWKTAFEAVGFLVLVGGAMLLLSGESDHDDGDDRRPSRGSSDEEEEDEVFYDAC